MSDVQVSDLSVEGIGEQLGELRCLNQVGPLHSATVRLSFDFEGDPDPIAIAALAQAMLVTRDDIELIVDLHDRPQTLRWLVRGGIVSALSRRTDVQWERSPKAIEQGYLWHTWTPGAHEAMAPMFEVGSESESLFGPEHAVFVNPHLTTEPYGHASLTPLVRRWLTQVVAPGLSPADHEAYIAAPIFAIDQLVHNVREHAIMPFNHALVDSVVALETVENRLGRQLRVSVIDTGAGVAQTLRPKLLGAFDHPDDGDLLTALLRGEVPGWDRGRGFGLATIAALVAERPGAALDVWSGEARVSCENEVVERSAPEVSGTVINAFFPLPAN
jgi:hypothetical protein